MQRIGVAAGVTGKEHRTGYLDHIGFKFIMCVCVYVSMYVVCMYVCICIYVCCVYVCV